SKRGVSPRPEHTASHFTLKLRIGSAAVVISCRIEGIRAKSRHTPSQVFSGPEIATNHARKHPASRCSLTTDLHPRKDEHSMCRAWVEAQKPNLLPEH